MRRRAAKGHAKGQRHLLQKQRQRLKLRKLRVGEWDHLEDPKQRRSSHPGDRKSPTGLAYPTFISGWFSPVAKHLWFVGWSSRQWPVTIFLVGKVGWKRYPLVNIQTTIENGHWNSWFTNLKWWFSIARLLTQRIVWVGMAFDTNIWLVRQQFVRQNQGPRVKWVSLFWVCGVERLSS